MRVDYPEHKSWLAAVSEMELAPSTDAGNFRIGDRVRVKDSVSSPKYGWGSASHRSIAVVKAINGETMRVDYPEHKSWLAAVSEMELAPSTDSENFRIGDKVRVKVSVSSPRYQWEDASNKSVGVITAIDGETLTVDFPERKAWKANVSEIELAPSVDSRNFRVGDQVRVKASVSSPRYNWGRASNRSVGVVTAISGDSMTVDFPEHMSWKADASEMELAPSEDPGNFRIGDRVRVKASVSSPQFGWGSASHGSIAVVTAINGETMTVDYPEHKSWKAAVSEMELAPSTDSGKFRIGDRVRVKASVTSPKHGWGDASHKSVGVVTALNGESMRVDYPEHKSWMAAVSEMELAPSTDSENFRIGDRVRVKASVSSPKYGWGSASHKSIAVVTAINGETMTVDYPEHKSWKAAVSEMELAPSTDSENFRIGDKVRVKVSVSSPRYQWEDASNKSVGVITAIDGESLTVDFPERKAWKANVSEIELAPSVDSRNFRVGDQVRVKASVSSPRYFWGLASNRSVGVVTAISGDSMTVDFPEHMSWKADASEMELAPSEDPGNFRIGDRVRVKASVSSPQFGWGSASHGSIAVVTAINGETMTVDYPEHKFWKAAVSEMELAPSTDSGKFRVGDRVRVKASVTSPKHGWGDASHKSVGVVTALNGERMMVDYPEHKSWVAAVSEMELAPSTDSENFRIGDRVRVKASVSSPKYGWGSASHKSIAVVTAINGETMTVDYPEHKSWKAAVIEMELAPSTDSENFRIGDKVRVKASVSSPRYQWEDASNKSVGVITAIDGESLTVDFPERKAWKANVSEIELAPSVDSRNFRVGDQVRVKASVSSPRYNWGRASNRSVGVVTAISGDSMTVDFPEHMSWKADASEMELAPSEDPGNFRIGDRVRVKASISSPQFGWGSASHGSIAVVTAIYGETMTVDYPEHKSWKAAVSEMELAPSTDSGKFRIGDRVRVKASVTSPKHGWGDASHKSVGVVTALNGESMRVDYPEHKSWMAAVSEMELAPSTDSENFRIGDRVRVKASVSSPKYGWGSASHKSIAVVTAINGETMIVDYPEHKSWKAAVSEMELAPSTDSENFRIGDKVRVKVSVSSPRYQWKDASNKSVGVITAIDGESLTVDFPERKAWKANVSEIELAPSVDSRNFRVGDQVRVKASVSSPRYNWGRASNRSVGVVTAISGDSMTVDFPEHMSWKADASEMELAPSEDPGNFRIGDRVRVKASVSSPQFGWGSASHGSIAVVTAIYGETMTVDYPEHKSWKAAVSEMELAPSTDSGKFRIGDRVRVKASVTSPKHGWGDASHKSVGVVTALNGESMRVDYPEHKSWMAAVSEMELAPSTDSENFRIGDRVRVKASVSSPKYGWGSASHKSIAVVTAINGETMTVDYPEHKSWKAAVSEMELAPSTDSGKFRIGDRVRVKASVTSPKHGWGDASHKSVGVVTALSGESMRVDYPEHKSWMAAVSEMELAPSTDSENFRIGDRVRVKASVSSPKYGWGSASHKSIAVVTAINGETMTVDYPEHKSWKAAVSEMELAPSTDSENFRIGDKVRVKASVSSPRYQWEDASNKSVGVITAIDGETLTVDFPERKAWKANVSEIELAPSVDSRNFRVGDQVRVKASVSSPRYNWGRASNRSVGVVKAISGESMTVDFPEHMSWKADASEMELAPSEDPGNFRTGDLVRVKASVTSPKHGWGSAAHKSVGVVTAINGESMKVDYPEHKSWTAAVSEMELASSADSESTETASKSPSESLSRSSQI
ncbi:uncharacterized protein [Hoplias malabaricus]|uniref:uncharacterized protein isoform X2 n=1 Tax=Hoplias malabaricus TaxID=27720 RepID=UPI003462EBE2